MRDPKRLEVADMAMQLAKITYLVTKGFPPDERFGLVAQMRRAAVSVGSNISEGCGRSTNRGFATFLEVALGSTLELDYQACIAMQLGHGDAEKLKEVRETADKLRRMLASLISAVKRQKASAVPIRAGGEAASPAP
jgi:four helix bundle protein